MFIFFFQNHKSEYAYDKNFYSFLIHTVVVQFYCSALLNTLRQIQPSRAVAAGRREARHIAKTPSLYTETNCPFFLSVSSNFSIAHIHRPFALFFLAFLQIFPQLIYRDQLPFFSQRFFKFFHSSYTEANCPFFLSVSSNFSKAHIQRPIALFFLAFLQIFPQLIYRDQLPFFSQRF